MGRIPDFKTLDELQVKAQRVEVVGDNGCFRYVEICAVCNRQ